ncbi:unnamed protein product [Adineta steineri]|uniref:Uncharacterized protein n=1 Tax=Adineta steineri TaxID=433720 RepID=A0A814Y355_9BILA|nr:unnamed protein product [Adineta steineri]CAF4061546.1 unnamed protein product [Adineta steineri]
MYHSLYGSSRFNTPIADNQIIIAFYQTTAEEAKIIAQWGFPVTGYRIVAANIIFTRTLESSNNSTAIICARLNLGKMAEVQEISEPHFPSPETNSLICRPLNQIRVRYPGQIENWLIALRSPDDTFDASLYEGCY